VGSGERKRNSTRERETKGGGVTRAHQFSQMHASEKDAIRIPNGKARLHERTGAVTLLSRSEAAADQPLAATPTACGYQAARRHPVLFSVLVQPRAGAGQRRGRSETLPRYGTVHAYDAPGLGLC